MDDGTRTHDNRNHNPGLYQLSYVHHFRTVACPTGLEPVTPSLEGWCSIRMSYGHQYLQFEKTAFEAKSRIGLGPRLRRMLPAGMRWVNTRREMPRHVVMQSGRNMALVHRANECEHRHAHTSFRLSHRDSRRRAKAGK